MLRRTSLILLESAPRARLKLLHEMDAELRRAEREQQANPGDPQAKARGRRLKLRAGPPDQDHNWRFNGKGWFTRPQWNKGRCPPGSEPTQHNTCIHPDDPDRQQYKTAEKRATPSYSSPDREDRERSWKQRAEIARTPEVENSPLHTKRATRVNWDHPHGPMLYAPYDNESPRPLPKDPEHLPANLTMQPTANRHGGWRERQHAGEMDRIAKHYVDAGYDEKYVQQALRPREQHVDTGSLSQASLDRLPPDRGIRLRAMKKAGEVERKRREAEAAAWAAAHPDDYHNDYEPYDDYDYDDHDQYDDYDYDGYHGEPIGGYKNHPGYPGHPDYPAFDGMPATREAPEDRYRLFRSPYDPPPEEEEDERESLFTGPRGRGEPSWPRTGQRPGRDWEDH